MKTSVRALATCAPSSRAQLCDLWTTHHLLSTADCDARTPALCDAVRHEHAQFTIKELADDGFTLKELAPVFSVDELRRANFLPRDLHQVGFKTSKLREGGFSVTEMREEYAMLAPLPCMRFMRFMQCTWPG